MNWEIKAILPKIKLVNIIILVVRSISSIKLNFICLFFTINVSRTTKIYIIETYSSLYIGTVSNISLEIFNIVIYGFEIKKVIILKLKVAPIIAIVFFINEVLNIKYAKTIIAI